MTYEQLLPIYRQLTGLPGQDQAFNDWVWQVQTAAGNGTPIAVDQIPADFLQTPAGSQLVTQLAAAHPGVFSGNSADLVNQVIGGTAATTATATTTGATTTAAGNTGASDLNTLLTELRLDPDFASLPAGTQNELANQILTGGLAKTGTDNLGWSQTQWQNDNQGLSADQNAALARWSQKATQNAATASTTADAIPLEQDILQQYIGGLLSDADHDTVRRELVAKLGEQAVADFESARQALSPEANAARLADELAHAKQTGADISSSAATAAADQLKALQDSIAAMQGNLTGDLATRAKALQDQIATLTKNLGTLDASQKATLAEQIAATQKDLETAITSQQQNLSDQITSLRGAADAQSVARRKALQDELDGLTAAQAPMAQARLDSANALATAVNLGLQSTQDQLTATRAKQGYLGASSFDNAALARAGITAGQQAAQAMGNARELNAQDLRTIQTHGATEGRSLADELANNLLSISGQEATGKRTLADLLATGTQSIGDTSAAGNAAISGATNKGIFDVTNAGANQTFQDQVFGADQQRALADALAKGSGAIGTDLATQQQKARDAATAAAQGYYDNAYTRQLAGQLALPTLGSSLTASLGSMDQYSNSGLNNLLNALNWWSSPSTAPTADQVATTADTTGNSLSSLGAGLLGSALATGNAAKWWQTPAATTPATTVPASSTSFWGSGGSGSIFD